LNHNKCDPARPTKQSDPRASKFVGGKGSVELDAIAPRELRNPLQVPLEQHLPADELAVLMVAEASVREGIQGMIERMRGDERLGALL
jgi:hypothetical protein